MKRICVYCGSSPGSHPAYLKGARDLGNALVNRGLGLVYGGARIGIMGCIADTVLAGGGEVIGVIPKALADREIFHTGLSRLEIVTTMHQRKTLMADRSDGFIALPGGLGTLEEIFEALTWAQLGFHNKPCGLLNIQGYYDHLAAFLDHAMDQGFVTDDSRSMLMAQTDPGQLLDRFAGYPASKAKQTA
jgi:uncharacterized protein (TIGR00730 family)